MSSSPDIAVLIVDDEPLVRTGLRSILERLPRNFRVGRIIEAEDGNRAMEILEKEKIDLVFSDMVMPRTDGLTLLAWISANRPNCRSIVLSCHDDYKYVRGSFKHNILDYILKYDIDDDIVKNVLVKLTRNPNEAESTVYDIQHRSVIENPMEEDIRRLMPSLLQTDRFQLILLHSDSGRISANLVEHRMKEIADTKILCLHPRAETHLILLETADGFSRESLRLLADTLSRSVVQAVGAEPTLIINPQPLHPAGLEKAAAMAWERMRLRFFKGPGIYWTDAGLKERENDENHERITALKAAVFKDLYEKNLVLLKQRLAEFGRYLEENGGFSVQFIRDTYIEFFDLITMFYRDELPYSSPAELQQIRSHIEHAAFLSTITGITESLFIEISKSAALLANPDSISMGIRRALVHIHSNYTSPNLSLAEVADELSYSHSYLSRQFKKEVGTNVVTYINQLRLKEARRLLSTGNYLIYEVAGLVGFNNYNYFSKLYKNYFGLSPNMDIHDLVLKGSG